MLKSRRKKFELVQIYLNIFNKITIITNLLKIDVDTWSASNRLTCFLYCWRIFQLNSSRIYYIQFYQLLVAATNFLFSLHFFCFLFNFSLLDSDPGEKIKSDPRGSGSTALVLGFVCFFRKHKFIKS